MAPTCTAVNSNAALNVNCGNLGGQTVQFLFNGAPAVNRVYTILADGSAASANTGPDHLGIHSCTVLQTFQRNSFPFRGKAGMGVGWTQPPPIPTLALPLKGREFSL